MSISPRPSDVSSEVQSPSYEVRPGRGGTSRLLPRGDQTQVRVAPVAPRRARRSRDRQPASGERDAILDITGIGDTLEPTDIARHEREYLAEALTPSPR